MITVIITELTKYWSCRTIYLIYILQHRYLECFEPEMVVAPQKQFIKYTNYEINSLKGFLLKYGIHL